MNPSKNRSQIPTPLVPPSKSLPRPKPNPDLRLRFSFSHWTQRENFGLDCEKVTVNWIAALLDQLKILSNHTIEELTLDRRLGEALRYHPIDWTKKNVQMKREEFHSLIPRKYRNEEYEIAQFQISQGNGRIIGFLDHEHIFQIVLLDPMHNMILSQKQHDPSHKIRHSTELLTPYQLLENNIQAIKSKIQETCREADCSVHATINETLQVSSEKRFICFEEYSGGEIDYLLAEKISTLDDLIIEALDCLYEKYGINRAQTGTGSKEEEKSKD